MHDPLIVYDPGAARPLGMRFDAVIVQPLHAADGAVAAEALAALDGRIVAQVTPQEAPALLDRYAGRLIVVLDAVGVPEEEAFGCAAVIAAQCHEREWPLLVAIAQSQIDVLSNAVAAHAPGTHLMCEALATDWAAALAVAADEVTARGSGWLGDRVRESEAARLTRLNEEVARIADVLTRLSRRDGAGAAAEARAGFVEAPTPVPVRIAAADVRDAIRARRLRERFFPPRLFEDPAWDIILDLFAAQLERAQVSVSSLCIAAAVAPTTALRWIGKLTEVGLLVREADPFDKRRAFMALSPEAREGMARYLVALEESGLPLV